MKQWYRSVAKQPLRACVLAVALGPPAWGAQDEAQWRVMVSPYTIHIHPSPEHKPVWAVGVERENQDNWVLGAAYFSNSFGQKSGYLSVGQRYLGIWDRPPLFFQWSAGLLYGYRGKYENKVPFNYNGFSPGAIVSLGWVFTPQLSTQVNLLGDAGVMFQFNYTLP